MNRLGYTHHGIDCGDETVIHYTGELGQKSDATVRRMAILDFALGAEVQIRQYGHCDDIETTISRAESRLDEKSYNLFFNNCEHLATWCKIGRYQSEQVNDAASTAGGTAGAGAAIAAGLGVVSATGAAAGLSGPGIMSGLAAVGGVVGGGAVAGIAIVGAAPAIVTGWAMMLALRDDPILHEKEREARRAGRYATVGGAATGTGAAIGAVAMSGSVGGLSAAAITSGLAAVGATVGGGMTAGVVVTAAAPAVGAVAIGYGAYRLWKWIRSGSEQEYDDSQPPKRNVEKELEVNTGR